MTCRCKVCESGPSDEKTTQAPDSGMRESTSRKVDGAGSQDASASQGRAQALVDQLALLVPNVARASLSGDFYRHRKRNAYLAAHHEAAYKLIGYFDSFCGERGIGYFAIARTLVGACAYGDFIPGTTDIELGMLREDYLAFEAAYCEVVDSQGRGGGRAGTKVPARAGRALSRAFGKLAKRRLRGFEPQGLGGLAGCGSAGACAPAAEEGACCTILRDAQAALPFVLMSHNDAARTLHRCMPRVKLAGRCRVVEGGRLVYKADHTPMTCNPVIRISVFDAVPDDYDFARMLFFRLKELGLLKTRVAKASKKLAAVLEDRAWRAADAYNGEPHREVSRLVPKRSKQVALGAVSSVKRRAFGPVGISCPADGSVWVVEDAQAQREQVEILQSDAKVVMAEIDRVCRANGISYFICGGTLLGYVRHGGFIPWDDDMDIGMLRADYERFLEVAASQMDAGRFFLQTRDSDPAIPYLFSKVRLKGSEYITKYNQFRDYHKGICVDVFPFDRVPFEGGGLADFGKAVRRAEREHNKLANRQVGAMPSTSVTCMREALEREAMSVRHSWYRSRSLAKTQRAYERVVTRFNGAEGLGFVASFVPTFTMAQVDDLLPVRDVDFEGMTLMAPANPEVFLQMQYGDYMTPPAAHLQRGHNLIWWSDGTSDASHFGKQVPEHAPAALHENALLSHVPAPLLAVGRRSASFLLSLWMLKERGVKWS